MNLKIGLVGATGKVGQTFIQLLKERQTPIEELRPFASQRSLGQSIECQGTWPIQTLKPNCFDNLDVVFFSSGDSISKEWAPQAIQSGAYAIDNSAAFRMDAHTPLVVPEINFNNISSQPQIIANPNCSTIQLVLTLHAFKELPPLKSVHVATYQAVSGAGQEAVTELIENTKKHFDNQPAQEKIFSQNIAFNALPHIGSFSPNGFSSEEIKIMSESRKILSLDQLQISAFAVRIPTFNAHSEAVWVEFESSVSKESLVQSLTAQEGVTYVEHSEPAQYPHAHSCSHKNDVFVGRLHQDMYNSNKWLYWVVGDNLRKGAALNGLQIAEKIFSLEPNA